MSASRICAAGYFGGCHVIAHYALHVSDHRAAIHIASERIRGSRTTGLTVSTEPGTPVSPYRNQSPLTSSPRARLLNSQLRFISPGDFETGEYMQIHYVSPEEGRPPYPLRLT